MHFIPGSELKGYATIIAKYPTKWAQIWEYILDV